MQAIYVRLYHNASPNAVDPPHVLPNKCAKTEIQQTERKLQTEMETRLDIQESERDLQLALKRRCDGGHQAGTS